MAWAWQIQYCNPLLLFSWEQIYCQNPYILREWGGIKEWSYGASHLCGFSFYKHFNTTKSIQTNALETIAGIISHFKNLLLNFYFEIIICQSVLFNNATKWHSNISVTHAHAFPVIWQRKRQRMRDWEREREGEWVNWLFMTPIK